MASSTYLATRSDAVTTVEVGGTGRMRVLGLAGKLLGSFVAAGVIGTGGVWRIAGAEGAGAGASTGAGAGVVTTDTFGITRAGSADIEGTGFDTWSFTFRIHNILDIASKLLTLTGGAESGTQANFLVLS